jgi:hypothetical protein
MVFGLPAWQQVGSIDRAYSMQHGRAMKITPAGICGQAAIWLLEVGSLYSRIP